MMKVKKSSVINAVVTAGVLLFTGTVFAEQGSSFCTAANVRMQGNAMILETKTAATASKLYFIENISSQPIHLNHSSGKNPHANAGWGSMFQASNWSAIMLDKPSFSINCATADKTGKQTIVNCAKVINVCMPNIPEETKMNGSYWVAEDKTWDDIVKISQERLQKH